MRILYCNKYNFRFSGTEAYLFELMEMMRARGHQTALFSMADARGDASEYDEFLVRAIDFKDPAAGWVRKGRMAAHAIYSREARRKLGGLIEAFRPEVAHVRNIYHHLSPSIFWELKKWNVPVIYHLNDFQLLCPNYNFVASGECCERCRGGHYWHAVQEGCYKNGRGRAAVLAAEAYVHRWLHTYERCVDLFLAPSSFVREKLIEYGWPAERIEVLSHFQRIPAEYPKGEGTDGVLYFGRLSAEKGLEDLLQAMARIPDVPLVIAGEGPMRADLNRLRENLGLCNATFVGQLQGECVAQAIVASRFTVFPSRAYETLGKSILESYAWGRPVLASDLGSRREFVRPGETGMLFAPGNIEQLADTIAFLYEQPALLKRMELAGREFLKQHHSPERHGDTICELYSRMAKKGGGKGGEGQGEEPKRLRVAFIGGRGLVSKYSGIEAYYEEVGSRLARRGHDITVYCRTYFTPGVIEHKGMKIVRLPTWRSKHWETVLHTALSTAHAMGRGFDVVHYHALGPALFSFLPRVLGIKTVVTVQGLDGERKKWGSLARVVLRLGEGAAIRCPDSTMVVSQTLRDHYHRRYGTTPLYVANGANLRTKTEPRKMFEWGLIPGDYVLFLGRFSPEKNCHLLIRAFEAAGLAGQLVLAGGFAYADAYAEELLSHASDKIHFLDYLSGAELDELLTNAMLFVLPSDMEGLSLALLDAMGAGLCVLASDIPENRELVEGAGYLFRPGDVAELEAMLRWLAASPSTRAEAGERARRRILAAYDWERITDEIEGEYLRITERRVPGTGSGPRIPLVQMGKDQHVA